MEQSQSRPPYVIFETRPVEDREASIAAGHFVTKDVHFAVITPQGSKDRFEQQVDEWFNMLAGAVRQGRFDQAWLTAFREAYAAYKKGEEAPLTGKSIREWPAVSPAQVRTLIDCNLRTVEDVAEMSEEAIGHLGLGGRALKDKAKAWLATAQGTGKVAEELAALRKHNETLTTTNEELLQRLEKLEKAAANANEVKVPLKEK